MGETPMSPLCISTRGVTQKMSKVASEVGASEGAGTWIQYMQLFKG
jgi:hypothetical protein